jgi:hypothetical protein
MYTSINSLRKPGDQHFRKKVKSKPKISYENKNIAHVETARLMWRLLAHVETACLKWRLPVSHA